jgi:hypothetical protein
MPLGSRGVVPAEVDDWLKKNLGERADLGFCRAMTDFVLEPPNRFDWQGRPKPDYYLLGREGGNGSGVKYEMRAIRRTWKHPEGQPWRGGASTSMAQRRGTLFLRAEMVALTLSGAIAGLRLLSISCWRSLRR